VPRRRAEGPCGAIYAQLVGESQFYRTARERIRTHQVNLRRAAVTKIWDRGELDPTVDPEVALDLIFGAACSGWLPGMED